MHRLGDGKVGGRVGLNVVDGDIPDRETTLRLQNLGGELDAIEVLVIGVIGDNRHIPQNRVGHHCLYLGNHVLAVDGTGHGVLTERLE